MAIKFGDVVQTIGEYNGKKRYIKIGAAFKGQDGAFFIKLDVLPMGKTGRDGYPECWLSIYPERETDQNTQHAQRPAYNAPRPEPDTGTSEEIPF